MTTSRELLDKYIEILEQYGARSKKAACFLKEHRFNQELYELAMIARKLKEVLSVPSRHNGGMRSLLHRLSD